MTPHPVIPVILCGGSGTRLWPASRADRPKQFLNLTNDLSLFQNTVARALRICGAAPSDVVIVTLDSMADAISAQFSSLYPDAHAHILREPAARNTGAAVAFAALYVQKTFGADAALWVLPSDHHIGDEAALETAFKTALSGARLGKLMTFGITPTRPDTGYGYIRAAKSASGGIHAVEQFVEKPDLKTAQDYVASGDYLWNSGMFLFTARNVLAEFEAHAQDIVDPLEKQLSQNANAPDSSAYAALPSRPFDKAIMEKTAHAGVVPVNPQWSDIGSWQSLWDLREKDQNSNVTEGQTVCVNAKNSLIHAHKTLIAVAGLDDIVVVETDDAILIMNKNDNDSMRQLVETLKTQKRL